MDLTKCALPAHFQDVELGDVPGESPYIGKARYKRNTFAVEGYIPNKAQKLQVGNLAQEEQPQNQPLNLNRHQLLDEQLEEKEREIKEGTAGRFLRSFVLCGITWRMLPVFYNKHQN